MSTQSTAKVVGRMHVPSARPRESFTLASVKLEIRLEPTDVERAAIAAAAARAGLDDVRSEPYTSAWRIAGVREATERHEDDP
jgi:hypothetical protein